MDGQQEKADVRDEGGCVDARVLAWIQEWMDGWVDIKMNGWVD